MNRQSLVLLIVCLGLMGATAAFLVRQRDHQRLGVPGVKVIAASSYDTEGKLVATNSVYLPEEVTGFKSEIRPITQDTLSWLPKDTTYGQRTYKSSDGFEAALNVVLMGTDRTSIHRPEWCLGGVGFAIDPQQTDTIPISEPFAYQLPVMKLTASKKAIAASGAEVNQRVIYLYWFVADHELTANQGQRMRWMARDMLVKGVLQRWAYVACISFCSPGQEATTLKRMKELIAAAVPKFQLATGAPAPLARNN